MTVTPVELAGQRVLITGVTGQVGGPVAAALVARGATVIGAARYSDPAARQRLDAAGVHTVVADLEGGDLSEVPEDVDYVLHLAVAKTNVFERDLAANAEGAGFLMERCRRAKAFLHCSSTAVYQPNDHVALTEDAELGDNHRAFGFMPTYSITKIAAEAVVRYGARSLGLPTVIARLNVPYGDTYGWMLFHVAMMRNGHGVPVHVNAPSQYRPIHHDDIVASIPYLLATASVPASIVNWGGNETVSIEEWCAELGALTGLTPSFTPTEHTIESVVCDTTKLQALGFTPSVHWRDGMARLVATSFPDLAKERAR